MKAIQVQADFGCVSHDMRFIEVRPFKEQVVHFPEVPLSTSRLGGFGDRLERDLEL